MNYALEASRLARGKFPADRLSDLGATWWTPTGPTSEPITVAEQKVWSAIDHPDMDASLAKYIKAAREFSEMHCGRCWVPRTMTMTLDNWPASGDLFLPFKPCIAVTGVREYNDNGTYSVFPLANLGWDFDTGRVYVKSSTPSGSRARSAIEISWNCGYDSGHGGIPPSVIPGLLAWVNDIYENRYTSTTPPASTGGAFDLLRDIHF